MRKNWLPALAGFIGGFSSMVVFGHQSRFWRALVGDRFERIDDEELWKRIRAHVDSAVSKPQFVVIEVREGKVRLSGEVARSELDPLLRQVQRQPGVTRLFNALHTQRAAR